MNKLFSGKQDGVLLFVKICLILQGTDWKICIVVLLLREWKRLFLYVVKCVTSLGHSSNCTFVPPLPGIRSGPRASRHRRRWPSQPQPRESEIPRFLTCQSFFYDWLTVHHSITLVDLQINAQNSCLFTYNTFIKILIFLYWYICLACLALQILMTGWPCIIV